MKDLARFKSDWLQI